MLAGSVASRGKVAKAVARLSQHRQWLTSIVETEKLLRSVAAPLSAHQKTSGAQSTPQKADLHTPQQLRDARRLLVHVDSSLLRNARGMTRLRTALGPQRRVALTKVLRRIAASIGAKLSSNGAEEAISASEGTANHPSTALTEAIDALEKEAEFATDLMHRIMMRKAPVAVSRLERALVAHRAEQRRRRSDAESKLQLLGPKARELVGAQAALEPSPHHEAGAPLLVAKERALSSLVLPSMTVAQLSLSLRSLMALEASRSAFFATIDSENASRDEQRRRHLREIERRQSQLERRRVTLASSQMREVSNFVRQVRRSTSDQVIDAEVEGLRHSRRGANVGNLIKELDQELAELRKKAKECSSQLDDAKSDKAMLRRQVVARPFVSRRLMEGLRDAAKSALTRSGPTDHSRDTAELSAAGNAVALSTPSSSIVATSADVQRPPAAPTVPSSTLNQVLFSAYALVQLLLSAQRHELKRRRTGASRGDALPPIFDAFPRVIRSQQSSTRRREASATKNFDDVAESRSATDDLSTFDAVQLAAFETLATSFLPMVLQNGISQQEFTGNATSLVTVLLTFCGIQRAAAAALAFGPPPALHRELKSIEASLIALTDAAFAKPTLLRLAPVITSEQAARILAAYAAAAAVRGPAFVTMATPHAIRLLAPRVLPTLGSNTHSVLKWKATQRDEKGAMARLRPSAHRELRSMAVVARLADTMERHEKALEVLSDEEVVSVHRVVGWLALHEADSKNNNRTESRREQDAEPPHRVREVADGELSQFLKFLGSAIVTRYAARRHDDSAAAKLQPLPLATATELCAVAAAVGYTGRTLLQTYVSELAGSLEVHATSSDTASLPPLPLLATAAEVLSELRDSLVSASISLRGRGAAVKADSATLETVEGAGRVFGALATRCYRDPAFVSKLSEGSANCLRTNLSHTKSVREALGKFGAADALTSEAIEKTVAVLQRGMREQNAARMQ